MRGLWSAYEAAGKKQPAKVESVFVLLASKQKIEKNEADEKARGASNRSYRNSFNDYGMNFYSRQGAVQPAEAILQTSMIAAVFPLLGGDSNYLNYDFRFEY